MSRCNQCLKLLEDRLDLKRHLSAKHFFYFPYSCQICMESDENHTTATEEDMERHIDAVHQGRDYNIISSKKKDIEDKIKAAIEECQSTSQNISLDVSVQSHNAPNCQSPFGRTTTESGSISPYLAQEQTSGETIENIGTDDIEILPESLPQNVKDEVATPKGILLGFHNALRRGRNIPCNGTPMMESGLSLSQMNQDVDNNDATKNVITDQNDDYFSNTNVKMEFNLAPVFTSANSTTLSTQSKLASITEGAGKILDHNSIESEIRTPLQSSSNNSSAKTMQRNRSLPINDRNTQTKTPLKWLNSKKTSAAQKPHKCDYCSYACSKKGNLVVHKRIHTGEKPYKCNKCSYASTQPGALKKHKHCHTDV